MLPSTHCSAARSWGGVRSNSRSWDDISVTLTSAPPVAPTAHILHVYLTATTVWVLCGPYAKAAVEPAVDGLCNTPTRLCTAPVDSLWISLSPRRITCLSCGNAVHHL
ncbi:hypothetical protein GCM10027176_02330 [Actinoallomurus bryophytorum]